MKIKKHLLISIGVLFFISCNKKESYKELPTLSNIETTLILRNSIKCKANIDIIGSGSIIECGICWSEESNPTIDNNFIASSSVSKISVTISNLNEETTYFIRAYAKNNAGTSYSEQLHVKTLNTPENGQVVDVDGNTYKTVLINNKWWMAENLKVTHYRNGDIIPNVIDKETWMNPMEGYRCYYGNDSITYSNDYGGLYNFLVVSDNRNVCPTGWHVPTLDEWKSLIEYCGGELEAPLKTIEPGSKWLWNTGFETNETGFSALGGGYRDAGGNYGKLNVFGEWWSCDALSTFEFGSVHLSNQMLIDESYYFSYGKSIRCVKD